MTSKLIASAQRESFEISGEFLPADPPARTTWSTQLRLGNGCEIACVALAG